MMLWKSDYMEENKTVIYWTLHSKTDARQFKKKWEGKTKNVTEENMEEYLCVLEVENCLNKSLEWSTKVYEFNHTKIRNLLLSTWWTELTGNSRVGKKYLKCLKLTKA